MGQLFFHWAGEDMLLTVYQRRENNRDAYG
jgi:hypothetical protein